MFYKDFATLFRQQVYALPYKAGLDLAITICKRLYFDYDNFVSVKHWGDKDLIMDAIQLCEQAKNQGIAISRIEEMLPTVDAITRDMDDFGNYRGSYALNAAASVYEALPSSEIKTSFMCLTLALT
jgi:uncharacterized protein YjaG (DUF416 family)